MGIRFACHECHKPLNIKNELAGKRGVCPQCRTRFRIPHSDTAFSIPVDDVADNDQQAKDEESDADSDQHVASLPAAIESPAISTTAATLNSPTTSRPRSGTPSLLDDPAATWYVRPPSGGQYGPATGKMLRGWIDEARVTPTALIWRDGWSQWRSAAESLVEFGGSKSSETVSPMQSIPKPTAPAAASLSTPSAAPVVLSGDTTIGARKSRVTQRRFVIVGTLAAISMMLIGILIFLLQR